MSYTVGLTADAVQDLAELCGYIDSNDVPGKADYVLGEIEKVLISLGENPNRRVYPGELSNLGIKEYREVLFKPYRIIYRVVDDRVFVLIIADGRRDMEVLLQSRLLGA